MSRVLEYVTKNYKCTTLEEFNTVLKLYNLEAYRGKENSQLYQHRGLLYRVLDENGRYIGVPLKASFFDCKPTLDNLEKQFVQHQSQKLQCRQHLATEIQWQLHQHPNNLDTVKDKLAKENIRMVLQKDKEGNCRRVTYIDFKNKFLFLGDELGEHCNATAIQKVIDHQKLAATQQVNQIQQAQQQTQQTQQQSARQTYRLRQSF
jgi:hypothetical protein